MRVLKNVLLYQNNVFVKKFGKNRDIERQNELLP